MGEIGGKERYGVGFSGMYGIVTIKQSFFNLQELLMLYGFNLIFDDLKKSINIFVMTVV